MVSEEKRSEEESLYTLHEPLLLCVFVVKKTRSEHGGHRAARSSRSSFKLCEPPFPPCLCGEKKTPSKRRGIGGFAEVKGGFISLHEPLFASCLRGEKKRYRSAEVKGGFRQERKGIPQFTLPRSSLLLI